MSDQGEGSAQDIDRASMLGPLLEISADLLAVVDGESRPIALSRSWEEVLGHRRDELMGTRLLDLVHPDQRGVLLAELPAVLAGAAARNIEVRLRCADGSYRWLKGGAVGDPSTGAIYLTAVDVDEQRALAEAMRAQLAREEVVATLATRLVGRDPDEVEGLVNASLEPLARAMDADRVHFTHATRYPEDIHHLEWYDPDTPAPAPMPHPDRDVQLWWYRTLRSGRVLVYEDVEDLRDEAPAVADALIEDGVRSLLHVPLPRHRSRWGFLTLCATRGKVALPEESVSLLRLAGEAFLTAFEGAATAVALADAHRDLAERNAALERSNQDLQHFAAVAAHDLKAPLAPVLMALGALARLEGREGELAAVAHRNAERMNRLIEDLLAYSRLTPAAGEDEEVDLDAVLDEVLADLEVDLSRADAAVERSALPTVRGRRSLYAQVLQNLVGNAVKFCPPHRSPVVRISATQDGPGWRLVVADNGIGVPEAERERVFGVFTRLHGADAYPGSGIGLATCRRVVEHHGGRIWIEDGIDGGTAVHLWLPSEPPAG